MKLSRKSFLSSGGGPECGKTRRGPDADRFPTVIEGVVRDGEFRLRVHDVFGGRIVFDGKIA